MKIVPLLVLFSALLLQAEVQPQFQSARPIWPKGREKEKNLFVGFRSQFTAPATASSTLRITGSTEYRIFLNGRFVGYGPARGPHGFYRVDEWSLATVPGANLLAIEVAGYNANSYSLLDQPSFLQAEVISAGKVLASTAGKGKSLEAIILPERVQKVQRYSFQRPFSEVYRLTSGFDQWRKDLDARFVAAKCSVQSDKAPLPRRLPFPEFAQRPPTWDVAQGELKTGIERKQPWKDRSLTQVGPKLGGYPESELATIPSLELQTIANSSTKLINKRFEQQSIDLKPNTYHILDFGCNLTGFLGAKISCKTKTRIFLTFDEILSNNDVNFKRLGCVNAIVYELEPGTYDVESFEPNTLRYLKIIALEGGCRVEHPYLREYANPAVWQAGFAASDERLNRLFAAARETLRQNAVDIFMDCPSRERAGWLCDSFFTARVAYDFSGNALVEKNFLENYALPKKFDHLPEGMLPMCYPADHNNGVFIPNWSLWFVVELEEYLARTGDRALVETLRPRVLKLLDYFKRFRNADGLLEKLESWVFVEWSDANRFVQDVNYPSNMLYAKALAAAGKMYGLADLTQEAESIRATIRKQSFDGEFFVDNALRKDGKLEVTRNRTEVCQYFAFFFEVATPETHPTLWQRLVTDFGPHRKQTKAFPEVRFANAFIGNQLRLELLSRYNRAQQNLDESIAYLLYMADKTGTLWEHDGDYASCNHGFASHAAHVLYRDVLGISQIDQQRKVVSIRLADLRLDWCQGSLPLPEGRVELRWRKDGEKIRYQVSAPAGYSVEVTNASGREAVPQP